MRHTLSSLLLAAGLLFPVLTACSGTVGDGSDDGSTDSADSEVKKGKKKQTCAAAGGACVALTPTACAGGTWADASKISCGGGLGVGCCLPAPTPPPPPVCPMLSPPAPGFCTGGTVTPKVDPTTGCTVGFDCVLPPKTACESKGGACVALTPTACAGGTFADASTHSCGGGLGVACCISGPPVCPALSPPGPGFCPGGTITPRVDPATGCTVGYDCTPPATTQCAAKGGTCVALTPSACPGGTLADAATHSCGGGLGVACCVP